MRFKKHLIAFLCFCLPLGLFAQSELVGTWQMTVPSDNGGTITINVSLNSDGTYGVDFGADGQVEVKGKYHVEGAKITVQNISGDECLDKGVYEFKVTSTDLIMNQVSDPCPNRGGPEGIMRFKKL